MINRLAFNRHFCIYYKLCLLTGHISAHRREYWVVVTVCLLALQDEEVTIIMQTRCTLVDV